MDYVFGPVPSRRLGRSLGIDPIPLKTCNWNCGYCQIGRTSRFETERAVHVPTEALLAEVRAYFDEHGLDQVDWITFVGSGEPTLHVDLGKMIREVKAIGDKPVAVITNGALCVDAQVREELSFADAVMPTISAGTEDAYLKLHRPAPGLDFASFIQGLVDFRAGYRGKLWAEVMLVAGVNDSEKELLALRQQLLRLSPDGIQIVLPTRPPAVSTVHPPDDRRLSRAIEILSEVAPTIAPAVAKGGSVAPKQPLSDTLVAMVQRHPMTEEELGGSLGDFSADELSLGLAQLIEEGRIKAVERTGQRYFSSAESRYS